jgi:tRNA-2-methylthio-N6-dimethylallyladenosine synthase
MKVSKRYYIKTYGCAMNYADSERIRRVLNDSGLTETYKAVDADIIILTSCSIRKQAEDKIGGWYNKARKSNFKDKVFVLTGCMAVRHDRKDEGKGKKYGEKLKTKYNWIDHVVDIVDIANLPKILGLKKKTELQTSDYLNILPNADGKVTSHVPISTGCDFFCSYCIVPFARGKLLQRNYEDILKEVRLNISYGVKLISLVAQNVNSWVGLKDGKKVGFADLLNDVCKIEGDFWITFVSSNPMDFSQEMIDAISKNPKIMRWINIAVQSGSDEILQKMNRRYSVREFEDLIKNIQRKVPDIRLTTDIIVGFPGETEEDFEKTVALERKLKFQMLYIGKYSSRPGAASAKFEDDIPLKEKKRREEILKDECNKVRKDAHKKLVGTKMRVLIVSCNKAISYFYHEVLLESSVEKNRVGTFVDVLITDSAVSGLVAKV